MHQQQRTGPERVNDLYREATKRLQKLFDSTQKVAGWTKEWRPLHMGCAPGVARRPSWWQKGRGATCVEPPPLVRMCMWTVNEIACLSVEQRPGLRDCDYYESFLSTLECVIRFREIPVLHGRSLSEDEMGVKCVQMPQDLVELMCRDRRFSFHSSEDIENYMTGGVDVTIDVPQAENDIDLRFTCMQCFAGRWNPSNHCMEAAVSVTKYLADPTDKLWWMPWSLQGRKGLEYNGADLSDGILISNKYLGKVCGDQCRRLLLRNSNRGRKPRLWQHVSTSAPDFAVKKISMWRPKRQHPEVATVDPDDIDSELVEPEKKRSRPASPSMVDADSDEETSDGEEEEEEEAAVVYGISDEMKN